MVIQAMPLTVSEEEYLCTPAFMRKNLESNILILLPTPAGDAQRPKPFRCVLNPTDTDGRRRAPEWLGPERDLPPISMRKIVGVLLTGRRVQGNTGRGVEGSARRSPGSGGSDAHSLKTAYLEVLGAMISRDHRTRANKGGRGEEVWAYDATDVKPEDETTMAAALIMERVIGLPSVYLQRYPCTA